MLLDPIEIKQLIQDTKKPYGQHGLSWVRSCQISQDINSGRWAVIFHKMEVVHPESDTIELYNYVAKTTVPSTSVLLTQLHQPTLVGYFLQWGETSKMIKFRPIWLTLYVATTKDFFYVQIQERKNPPGGQSCESCTYIHTLGKVGS